MPPRVWKVRQAAGAAGCGQGLWRFRAAGGPALQTLLMASAASCHSIPQVVIHSLEDAHEEIDRAISAALLHSKPCYICVCCNLACGCCRPAHRGVPAEPSDVAIMDGELPGLCSTTAVLPAHHTL